MIKNDILNLLIKNNKLNSYNVGLIQAKAYRALKHTTQEALKAYHISSLEWAALGLLFDETQGLRALDLAQTLGVEAPFISVMIKKLEDQKWLVTKSNPTDKRAKIIRLTAKGRKNLPVIEAELRDTTRHLLDGLNPLELMTYVKVLNTIVKNNKSLNQTH